MAARVWLPPVRASACSTKLRSTSSRLIPFGGSSKPAVPVADRFPAGYLVQWPGHRVLVDCGPGSLRRLAQAGVTLRELDAVLLTHYHTDHCADLAALLFALRSPHFAGRPPLLVFGAPGLQRLVDKLTEAWPWLAPRGYELVLHEIAPGTFPLGDATVQAIPIRHTAQSLGYRLTRRGATVAFSGDADECDELVDLGRDADVFVCEAATPVPVSVSLALCASGRPVSSRTVISRCPTVITRLPAAVTRPTPPGTS